MIVDLNGDGRLDVVMVDNFLGDIVWFENPGKAALVRGVHAQLDDLLARV